MSTHKHSRMEEVQGRAGVERSQPAGRVPLITGAALGRRVGLRFQALPALVRATAARVARVAIKRGVIVVVAASTAIVIALAVGDVSSGAASDRTLTIYSSLPLQGTSRMQSQAVVRGEKLALAQAGSTVGRFKIKLVSLDDSSARNPGSADERATARNARRAARDTSTIFYLGEFQSSGTQVSLPILNRAGIAQISPSNTYIGLTVKAPGSEPGDPDRYYPTKKRTYARVLPNDAVQGAALATLMHQDGCATATLWNDGTTYGRGLARNVELAAKSAGLTIENQRRTDPRAKDYRAIASQITSDCFAWTGFRGGVQVFKDVAKANGSVRLYAGDSMGAFTNPRRGGVPAAVGARIQYTSPTLGVGGLPAAEPVVKKYKKTYGTHSVDPYAIYGYEAMALALDALARAGDNANDRAAVVKALFATKDRSSVIGTYSIDANGDTTLRDYGVYIIRNALPTYSKKIVALAR